MTVQEYLASLPKEKRCAVVGSAEFSLLAVRAFPARAVAAAAWNSWACPDYLAEHLGLTYQCQNPRNTSQAVCERCAAAFLSAQMPNTGGPRNHGRKDH